MIKTLVGSIDKLDNKIDGVHGKVGSIEEVFNKKIDTIKTTIEHMEERELKTEPKVTVNYNRNEEEEVNSKTTPVSYDSFLVVFFQLLADLFMYHRFI